MAEDDHKPICDCCGYEPVTVQPYSTGFRQEGEKKYLCALCAGTHAGIAHEYPKQYPEVAILKTACYIGNVILAELRKRLPLPEDPA